MIIFVLYLTVLIFYGAYVYDKSFDNHFYLPETEIEKKTREIKSRYDLLKLKLGLSKNNYYGVD
jgi:hypothetical protein